MTPYYERDGITIYHGDSLDVLRGMPDASVDACVTDPPYGLSFMGKEWDHGVPGEPYWRDVLRVLKPGGHLLAFGGTRTHHRLMVAIEDAGFEIRDCLMWLYGSGFPKSLDVSKAIDKMAGAEREVLSEAKPVKRIIPGADQHRTGSWIKDNGRTFTPRETAPATDAARQWEGWGTALKPAYEPIILARKPLVGTVAQNVLEHGTGGLNIDGCRLTIDSMERDVIDNRGGVGVSRVVYGEGIGRKEGQFKSRDAGRWPANVVLDEEAARLLDAQSGGSTSAGGSRGRRKGGWARPCNEGHAATQLGYGDTGGASRFMYCAKASRSERGPGNDHPTVKPLALLRWLVRLVTPRGGIVLDPFLGSGTALLAAQLEGCRAIGIELEERYCEIAANRLSQMVLPELAEAGA